MQETTLFDTHAAVKRLTEAGMPVSQAEAVVASQAEVMLHSLANKQDIESFRSETTENFASTHKSVDALRAEVADCHRNVALTRKDIEILRTELSRDLTDGLHRQNRFMLTALMGFALLIIASIEVRLLA